jgi:hypothetical protein
MSLATSFFVVEVQVTKVLFLAVIGFMQPLHSFYFAPILNPVD